MPTHEDASDYAGLPRRVTHTPEWAVGMQKIGPGFYVDGLKELHVDEAEVCESLGVPFTEANDQLIEAAAREVYRDIFGREPKATTITHQEKL